jgi:hypothetical protein
LKVDTVYQAIYPCCVLARITFLLVVAFSLTPLAAQSSYQAPNLRNEAFAGFATTLLRPGRANGDGLDRVRVNGWTASITTYQFFRRWGLAAEFSGQSRDRDGLDVSSQSYLFGGTYRSFERRRFALTGRILAGVNRWDPAALTQNAYRRQNGFTFAFGQSIDIKLSENFALRVQPDLALVRRRAPDGAKHFSLATPFSLGAVFKFGGR